jgi:nitric-oxide synthase, bacterial
MTEFVESAQLVRRAERPHRMDRQAAEDFLRLFHHENPQSGPLAPRLREVMASIERTGHYDHTFAELQYGARVAWRNSSRCIGRLYWRSLRVRDRRTVRDGAGIAAELAGHLREATNGGRIRPTITVFPPDDPLTNGPRIHNDQLIRYAGHRSGDGVIGDPARVALTDLAKRLGWRPGPQTPFDVLPLILQTEDGRIRLHQLPADVLLEVELTHPAYPWFKDLGLRWYAVPAISDMCLEIGGLHYPAAPFNGWYMGTEIGARNFADTTRYDLLPEVARRLGLDTSRDRTLWRDRALVELNLAVLYSFDTAAVTIADHHTESHRFLTHLDRESAMGRMTPADWSWIVPPISGSATPVFHRTYDDADLRPNFITRAGCPRHARAASPGETPFFTTPTPETGEEG